MPEAKFVSEALLNHGINLKYRPKIRVALSGLYCTVLGLQSYHRTIDGHNLRSVLKPPLARELKDGSWGEFRPDYSLCFQSLGMWKEALKQIKLAEEALRVALAEERNPELRAALMDAYKETLAASATLSFDQHNAAKLNQHISTLDAARLALVPLAAVDFTRGAGQILEAATPPPAGPQKPTHSPDFTSVDWFGTRYSFAKGNQAESVRVLWKAWENGGHSLSQETIGDSIKTAAGPFELAKVFRRKVAGGGYQPHPAWRTMIQSDSKGSYRLIPPESE